MTEQRERGATMAEAALIVALIGVPAANPITVKTRTDPLERPSRTSCSGAAELRWHPGNEHVTGCLGDHPFGH
ncbi:hypothetical protein BH23ACT5_BH23ACT5_21290 [soil metagenome]